jgi:cyanate permease
MVLAHQGGWDETLLVLAPVAVVAVVLWLANRRAKRLLADRQHPSPAPQDAEGPPAE